MSDQRDLTRLVTELMSDNCGPEVVESSEGGWSGELWSILDGLGLTGVGIGEEEGGSGGDLHDVAAIVRTAARFAAPLPLTGTLVLAPALRRQFGLPHRRGASVVTIDSIVGAAEDPEGWHLRGDIRAVPYGHIAENLLVLGIDEPRERIVLVELSATQLSWRRDVNVAGEPRDGAQIDVIVPEAAVLPSAHWWAIRDSLHDLEALGLSWAMVGAMERIQDLVVDYTGEREQFGRPISRFQAVRQLAAECAGHIAVAAAAAREATAIAAADGPSAFPIAACRARAAMSATDVSRIAHQLHGALGFTREYPLHHYTRRLWAWRDEGGTAAQWTELAGRRILANGPDHFWPTLTT